MNPDKDRSTHDNTTGRAITHLDLLEITEINEMPETFENPARAEDQRNEVRLAFGVVWFRS